MNIYGDYIKASEEIDCINNILIDETYIFSKDNYEFNLEKWKPGVILYITGSSGDGKSYLAEQLAKENNAYLGHTDTLLLRLHKTKEVFKSRLELHPEINEDYSFEFINKYNNQIPYGVSFEDATTIRKWFKLYFNWLRYEFPEKYKNKKIILEGCEINNSSDVDYIATQPLIIMGTSRLKSSIQRIHRDRVGRYENSKKDSLIKAIFNELKRKPMVNRLNNEKDEFLKNIEDTNNKFKSN